MVIKRLNTATCYFHNSDTKKSFPSVPAARAAAEAYVGNTRFAKPFPNEETYLYGPGDGTTTVMVRQDIEIVSG